MSLKQESLSKYIEILRGCKAYLSSEFNIDSIAIFGSIARRQYHRVSDIDILVHFLLLPSFFELAKIEGFLYERLQLRVDLVIENGADEEFMRRISRDIIRI